MDDQGLLLMTPDGAPLSPLEACKINAVDRGMGDEFKTTWRSWRRDILFLCCFFPSTNLSFFISSTPCRAVRPSCTRHVFVCSETSFSVHCYPINVSIFVQLYTECKPEKPLARPLVSRPFSSAGSKQLRLCSCELHIHRVSRRACILACALQVKSAQVVLDKRLMGGGIPLILICQLIGGGGGFFKFWLQVFVLRSSLCECTSPFPVIVSLDHLPFPVPPCLVTLSYIALCCPISPCVHLSYYFYHVLSCPQLLGFSRSALSHSTLS